MVNLIEDIFEILRSLPPRLLINCENIHRSVEDILSEDLSVPALPHGLLSQSTKLLSTNSAIWMLEDKARDHGATNLEITQVKKSIDRLNQKRNDQIEDLNNLFFEELGTTMNPNAPLFSETPGSIIDRLGILMVRQNQMRKRILQETYKANNELKEQCRMKEKQIIKQAQDLKAALIFLIEQVIQGKMKFHLYFQYKMYNDKHLNPYLYKSGKTA